MKNSILVLLAIATCAFAQAPVTDPSSKETPSPELRPRLFDFAGVLGNEGFKVRDGAWTGRLLNGKPQRLAVNLFAGNQYWFCAATSDPAETPSLSLRDPSGHPVEVVRSEKDGVAAVGVTAGATGRYTLELKGSSPGTRSFCLLYLFK